MTPPTVVSADSHVTEHPDAYRVHIDPTYRDRAYIRARKLQRRPSEYVREHVYTTFQDDWVALRLLDLLNPRRVMWANDFPHSDSTWPRSQGLIAEHFAAVGDVERACILHDNVTSLYGLPV
jgi:predicted TIM-barrel fold metal-dependent hydrolase